MIGVAWTGTSRDYDEFVERHGITFASLDDTSGTVYDRFDVPYQPAFAIITADGRSETLLGAADDALLDMIITQAIG